MKRATGRIVEVPRDRPAPTVIGGKYEVLGAIADGALGTTYRTRHVLLDGLFAVTLLPASLTRDDAGLARLREAVRTVAGLRHDHVVPVLDLCEDADGYHLV